MLLYQTIYVHTNTDINKTYEVLQNLNTTQHASQGHTITLLDTSQFSIPNHT